MPTTEQAPPHTEAPKQERVTSREKLEQQKLQREVAMIALLAILMANYTGRDSDHLFARHEQRKSETPNNQAEIFGLITGAISRHRELVGLRPFGAFGYEPNGGYNFRESKPDNKYSRPASKPPVSEFRPAPSMADTELGPQLPNLAFNDRIRPWDTGTKQPSDADFAAADRANNMYQRALFDTGWRGGEASPDQQKQATRGMMREYHPDLPTTSAADADAVKMFNASTAKPVTRPDNTPPASQPSPQ